MNEQSRPADRYRFDRRNNVVRDVRVPGATVGTVAYQKGDPLFAAKSPGSKARADYRAGRVAAREAARSATARAINAVHEAASQ